MVIFSSCVGRGPLQTTICRIQHTSLAQTSTWMIGLVQPNQLAGLFCPNLDEKTVAEGIELNFFLFFLFLFGGGGGVTWVYYT